MPLSPCKGCLISFHCDDDDDDDDDDDSGYDLGHPTHTHTDKELWISCTISSSAKLTVINSFVNNSTNTCNNDIVNNFTRIDSLTVSW